ncbi:hypothetical protein MD484_g7476, partial [Candolleomyces efflorescens]
MKLSLRLISTLVSVTLCGIVYAAPAPIVREDIAIDARDIADSTMADDLFARAKSTVPVPPAANLIALQKAQGRKPDKKAKRKEARAQTLAAGTTKINNNVNAWAEKKTAQNAAKLKATGKGSPRPDKKKQLKREQNRYLTQARKDKKAAKGAAMARTPEQRAAKKKASKAAATARRQQRKATGAAPPPNKAKLPKNIKPTQAEKKQVKDYLQVVRKKYAATDMPSRGSTATVGPHSATGREVRQSVFNNYLYKKTPLGTQQMPKPFNNEPYSNTHGDAALRGTRPLPATGRKFREFPIVKQNPSGWTGQPQVGALRTITYKEGDKRYAKVIGHDSSRPGSKDDHYVATITRELEDDFE